MVQTEVLDRKSIAGRMVAARWLSLLLGGAVLFGVLLLLIQAALHKQLNHDENMYISSGVLLHEGKLPYRDYPYFQMPLLTLVYAAVLWTPGDLLLGARFVNTLCAFAACLVLFLGVWFLGDRLSVPMRTLLGVAGVILYVSNPELAYASGLAWNHDLPILLVVGGVVALARSFSGRRDLFLLFVSGLLFGLAASARLSFAVVIPALGLIVLVVLPASSVREARARARRCLAYSEGVLAGLLPALVFFSADPVAFWFGNVEYHRLNEQFWLQSGYTRAMTLSGKLRYLSDVLFGEPFNWLIVGGSIAVVFLVWRTNRRSKEAMFVYLPALAAVALFVGALIPTPTWLQYFYAPYALLAFTFVYGIACLTREKWALVSQTALVAVTVIAANSIIPRYVGLTGSTDPGDSVPAQVGRTAAEIREAVGKSSLVATLAPVYVLEAGLHIYPELGTGPFLPRVAPFLPKNATGYPAKLSRDGIGSILLERQPDALLTGLEGGLDDPLVEFATAEGYKETTLSNGLTLWVQATNVH